MQTNRFSSLIVHGGNLTAGIVVVCGDRLLNSRENIRTRHKQARVGRYRINTSEA